MPSNKIEVIKFSYYGRCIWKQNKTKNKLKKTQKKQANTPLPPPPYLPGGISQLR